MKKINLDELVAKLQVHQHEHGKDEVSYSTGRESMDILIGKDPEKGCCVSVPYPGQDS